MVIAHARAQGGVDLCILCLVAHSKRLLEHIGASLEKFFLLDP